MLVPEGSGEVILGGDPGPEVLYLILSRTELSLADPHLADAIAAAGRGIKAADCGESLDAELARPAHPDGAALTVTAAPTPSVLRGFHVPKKRMPAAPLRGGRRPWSLHAGGGSGSSSHPGGPQPVAAGAAENQQDEPDFIRSPGAIVWYGADGALGPRDAIAADVDGIAVVRYRFNHVAPTSSP